MQSLLLWLAEGAAAAAAEAGEWAARAAGERGEGADAGAGEAV